MTRAPRSLFVHDHLGYATGALHGVTTYFLDVLPRLREEGAEVGLCVLRGRHAGDALRARGVEVHFLERAKWDPRVLTDMIRLVRRGDYDLLQLGGLRSIFLGRAAARLTGCHCVVHLHDMLPIPAPLRLLLRSNARWTDRAIAGSKAVCAFATSELAIAPDRVRLIPNGRDLERFLQTGAAERGRAREQLGVAEDVALFGLVGRVERIKGQADLIRAAPKVLEALPAARFLLVGDGSDRERCQALSRELGLEDAVTFTGHRDEVSELLAAIDVVVVPSSSEAFSYVTLEAMASARPVVAFATGGLPELVDDGKTGILVPPGDTDALARAMLRVAKDGEGSDRMGRAARARSKRFTVGSHVRQLMDVHRDLRTPGGAGSSAP